MHINVSLRSFVVTRQSLCDFFFQWKIILNHDI